MPAPKPPVVLDKSEDAYVAMRLSTADVRELSKSLGLNINSSEMLVSRVKAMTALDIDGLEIVLEPALLQRLKSRCVRQDFQQFLSNEITRQLRAYVGM